jgi:hypothetical protein
MSLPVIDKHSIEKIKELARRGHQIFDDALLLGALRDMVLLYDMRIRNYEEFLEEIKEFQDQGRTILWWKAEQDYGGLPRQWQIKNVIDKIMLVQAVDPEAYIAMIKHRMYEEYLEVIAWQHH